MKKGKSAFGIMIVSLLLVSSIVMVSAGWKDLFTFGEDSDLEGELASQAADVEVTISMDNTDPVVVYISEPLDGGVNYEPTTN